MLIDCFIKTQTCLKRKNPSVTSALHHVCLLCVLTQGCHITPVLHFQAFNPRPPLRYGRRLHQRRQCSLGSKVKGSAHG